MLDLAILGLLKEQDLHGYELKKRLSDTLGLASGVSFGSLYPALARLERAGAVAASASPDAGRARSRKVYVISARGHELFDELLAADAASIEDGRMFHLRLAFARYLPAEARLGMLERRRAQLLERLHQTGVGRVGRLADRYVRSLIDHEREATEHDLSWIERLIAAERALRVPAAPEAPTASALRRVQPLAVPPPAVPTPTLERPAPAPPSLTGLSARFTHQEELHP